MTTVTQPPPWRAIEHFPPTEPAARQRPSTVDRMEILLVADDRRKAESDVHRLGSVDDVFVAPGSAEALDLLCRLREYEYRANDRDLRVLLVDPRYETDLSTLYDRLSEAGHVAHFPIVRAVRDEAGAPERFEAVHHHQFEALLDTTRACCVLLWERCRMAA